MFISAHFLFPCWLKMFINTVLLAIPDLLCKEKNYLIVQTTHPLLPIKPFCIFAEQWEATCFNTQILDLGLNKPVLNSSVVTFRVCDFLPVTQLSCQV